MGKIKDYLVANKKVIIRDIIVSTIISTSVVCGYDYFIYKPKQIINPQQIESRQNLSNLEQGIK